MVMTKTVHDSLTNHINVEFYSSYLYLSLSAYCESINLPGFASWLRVQSQEENNHAMRLFDYVNDREEKVNLLPISQPPVAFQSALDVMQSALDHERKVTELIHQAYALAIKEDDYATQVHLQWFITEQVEDEKEVHEIIEQLKMIGDKSDALLILDRQLAERGS